MRPEHIREIQTLRRIIGFLCFAHDGKSFLRESYNLPYHSAQRLALWDFTAACVRTYPRASATQHQSAGPPTVP